MEEESHALRATSERMMEAKDEEVCVCVCVCALLRKMVTKDEVCGWGWGLYGR